jgi:uncharacterized protein (DUF983 family)
MENLQPGNKLGKPPLLTSLLSMKCPNCRKGRMFKNKSLFPLGQMLDMPEACPVCKQKMELEPGFYYGTGYVSYGLSVGITILVAVLFALTWGFSYKDYSIFYFLGMDIFLLILLQPYLMRISRVIYLYMFVKYGEGARMKSQ